MSFIVSLTLPSLLLFLQENNYIENDIDTIEEADYVQEITDESITREIKDKNYVIFVEPTLFYLDSLKNVSKDDDFYTTVDDATFYMTMASDLALLDTTTIYIKLDLTIV